MNDDKEGFITILIDLAANIGLLAVLVIYIIRDFGSPLSIWAIVFFLTQTIRTIYKMGKEVGKKL